MKIENGFKARQNTIRMNIVNALTSLFSLQMGEFRFWRTTDCLDMLYSDSPFPTNEGCYFENPGAPYGLLMLPPHNEEALDEYWGYPVSDGNLSATWHMKPTDVLVLAGRTPPPPAATLGLPTTYTLVTFRTTGVPPRPIAFGTVRSATGARYSPRSMTRSTSTEG